MGAGDGGKVNGIVGAKLFMYMLHEEVEFRHGAYLTLLCS